MQTQRVEAVRAFNRFYTRHIGVLDEGLLQSRFSLTEARLLFELAQRGEATASDLTEVLRIDPGYLSRLLKKLTTSGLVRKRPARSDARKRVLTLTRTGERAFSKLDRNSKKQVGSVLRKLSEADQQQLVGAMAAIQKTLSPAEGRQSPFLLRTHEPGDVGHVISRHGALYAKEYGFDQRFEADVAEILARFLKHYDEANERLWIAERDGERLGAVALTKAKAKPKTAQLRVLLVEPHARGQGLGEALIEQCIRFARERRFDKLILWTQKNLKGARRLYKRAGFTIREEKPHQSWGQNLVAEIWELPLSGRQAR